MLGIHAPTLADLMWLPGLIIGFTVHELGHALVAYWMGDRGELTRERITLNPVKHVPWLGLAAFLLLGIGWAKPVRFRPGAFKRTNLGSLLVSLAGVTANTLWAGISFILILIIGVVGAVIAPFLGADGEALVRIVFAEDRFTVLGAMVGSLTGSLVNVNIMLALFNLLPIPGFDGFHALVSLWRLVTRRQLPEAVRNQTQAGVAFEEGNFHARAGRMPQAVEAWRRAVRLFSSSYGALYNLGLAYAQAGQRNAAIGALANARIAALGTLPDPGLAAPTNPDQERASALLRQVGWDRDEPPPPVPVDTLPELLAAPQSPEEEASASRRRVLKIVGVAVGVLVGVIAYMALMMFLALLAAGMRL
jgi:Zn-dependent protease